MNIKFFIISVFLNQSCFSQVITTNYFKFYELRNQITDGSYKDFDIVFDSLLRYELPITEIKKLKIIINKSKEIDKDKKKIINQKIKNRKRKKDYNFDYINGIEKIYKQDQKVRNISPKHKNDSLQAITDSLNKIELQLLINKYGLPTLSTVDDNTIGQFGVLINHYIYDSNFVTVEKVENYFDNGSILGFLAVWAIDKHYILVSKREKSYFNTFFLNPNQLESNGELVAERLKKFGISYKQRIKFY